MTKYRVYIKKAEENLTLSRGFSSGSINGNTGVVNTQPANYLITDYLIPVEHGHKYKMIRTSGRTDIPEYFICEYSDIPTAQDNNYITNVTPGWDYGSIPMLLSNAENQRPKYRDVEFKKIYTPSENAKYIRIQIDTSYYPYEYMFLKNQKAYLIHDSMSPNKEDHLLNCNLHLEDCSAGYLDFTVWPGHSYYKNKINIWTDTIYVTRTYNNGSERIIWDGRPISEDISTDKNITYHCEGALAYLNDYRVAENNQYDRPSKMTINNFILDFIIGYQNSMSISQNIMDRSFYHSKDQNTGELIESISIFCDTGTRYDFSTNNESGLKWINDIKEAFGGHYKIRYRGYDSPNDDIICRCFTYIKDFNQYDKIIDILKLKSSISGNYTFYIGDYIYYKFTSGRKVKYNIYIIKEKSTFDKNKNISTFLYEHAELIACYVNNHPDDPDNTNNIKKQNSEELTDSSTEFWIIYPVSGTDPYAIHYINRDRYQKIYAKFGSEIFDASKSTEIKNFATIIIPRGIKGTTSSEKETNVYINTRGIFINGEQKTFNWYQNTDRMLDDSLIKRYGAVMAVVDFEGADTPKKLYNQANEWFKDLKNGLLKKTISITLSGLTKLVYNNNSDPFSDPEYIDLWTQIYANIPEIGMSEDDQELYYVSSLDIPLDDYLNTSITLVNNADTISDQAISNGDIKGASKGIIDSGS